MSIEPLAITAYTATNALGQGNRASLDALRSGKCGLRPCHLGQAGFRTWIGEVEGLDDAPLEGLLAPFDCRNNRLAWMGLGEDGFRERIERAKHRYGAARVGIFLGSSTFGIEHSERCYQERAPEDTGPLSDDLRYRYTQSPFSLGAFCRETLGLTGPTMVISTACSSSAKVFAAAQRHIATGLCDAALVGGVDSLCKTTLYGFHSLDLVSPEPCRPWDRDREGINLGEAAGFVLLEPWGRVRTGPVLLGYGESSDAYHMSAPHPQGTGASAAMKAALAMATLQPGDIDYINLHGTATRSNDQSEDRAVTRVFHQPPPSSSTKGWTGHTLGAAGITEAVFCLLAIEHGFLPGSLNTREPDPKLALPILLETRNMPVRRVMSNSFGFGGSNCCLILGQP